MSCASLDGAAVVALVARAAALLQLVAALLALQDADRVEAALRAAPPAEHGAAEAVVVLQGGRALQRVGIVNELTSLPQVSRAVALSLRGVVSLLSYLRVGGADPLCRRAGDDGVWAGGVGHLRPALLHVRLGRLALLVTLAVALKNKKKIDEWHVRHCLNHAL